MGGFWDIVFSPAGLAAYAAFWAMKLLCGAWLLRKGIALLPERAQIWAEAQMDRLPKWHGRSVLRRNRRI